MEKYRAPGNYNAGKKIFTLTEYIYKEFKRKDFTIYVFYSALNQYFVISPFELMTIWSLLGMESAREAK